ncbi:MAG TPA: DUF4142 domain-containing protein [Alphaproteobacteria bacterium]|nr:DUF4142 domain-containing protein [Alphaproteobacteria bacterium]
MKFPTLKFGTYTTALVGIGIFSAATAVAEGSAEKFITSALEGNLAEVNMGKLAEQNSDNPKVKSFGTTLRADHSAAYRAAAVAATAIGQPVPTEPSKAQQDMYYKLAALKGTQFDQAFTEHAIEDHKDDIAMYEKEAKAKDGVVSEYAAKTLPTLRKHLDMATKLAQ